MKLFKINKPVRVAVDVTGQDAENWEKMRSLIKTHGIRRPDAIRKFNELMANDIDFVALFAAKVSGMNIVWSVAGGEK